MIHKGYQGKQIKSFHLLHRLVVQRALKCSYFCPYFEFYACECGWIISLYSVAFGLSQKCFPQSKTGLHLWGLGWDFHFLETPSVLFCMLPLGTTVLIFLEGMFREPQSPRGKDNGGCDVTSILGASGGKEKSWVALMSSATAFLKELHGFKCTLQKNGSKWLLVLYVQVWWSHKWHTSPSTNKHNFLPSLLLPLSLHC